MVNPNKIFRTNFREERKILQEISDEQLVREFKKGNLEAFDHLVRKHQDRVYRLTFFGLETEIRPRMRPRRFSCGLSRDFVVSALAFLPLPGFTARQSMYAVNTTENKYLKISMNPLKFLAIGLILS